MLNHTAEELFEVIKTLNERIWGNKLSMPAIDRWLENFTNGDEERLIALHLLAQFMYFGNAEIRILLQSLYRDLYRMPILEQIRGEHNGEFDHEFITRRLREELYVTKFLGVGNPSESGSHLLYYFRQENQLSKEVFINTHEIFKRTAAGERVLRDDQIKHYVFIDDLCGSGTQAVEYSEDIVEEIKSRKKDARVYYFALFGLESGLSSVRSSTVFDVVDAVFVLDTSFSCFDEGSRYFLPDEEEARRKARETMSRYGERLLPGHGLGYKDSQLLLGFFYNVPDNTLPVIWCENDSWTPIFRRYPKF